MDDEETVLDIAIAWRPQRPGSRPVKDIADALVEPEWGGLRVVAALTVDRAVIVRDGAEIPVPDEVTAELVVAFNAVDALVEGYLTTVAFQSGEGALPPPTRVERPPILIPRAVRKSVKDDPYVRARDYEVQARTVAPEVLEALEQGERHAFVASDLLWLDGQRLDDIPLLERKRLLDGVLEPSFLVRVTPQVKSTAILTLVTWGTLGFGELHYRAANSRYLAGRQNPEWAVGRPPEGPMGPPRAPIAKR